MTSPIPNGFDRLPAFHQLLEEINAEGQLRPVAISRAARLPMLAEMLPQLKGPLVYILAHSDQAQVVQEELNFWSPGMRILNFAEPPALFYEKIAWGETVRWERIKALAALADDWVPGRKQVDKPLIITTVKALMTRTLPRRDFLSNCLALHQGQSIALTSLLKKLVRGGYEVQEVVVAAGQVSHRGGIVDAWAPNADLPVRLEFFGDEVETIRTFDPASQRSVQKLETVFLTPAREVFQLVEEDGGEISEKSVDEFELPLIHPTPASMLDYLPEKALIVQDDAGYLETVATEIEEQSLPLRQEAITAGWIDEGFPTPYLTWSELTDTRVRISWLDLGYSGEKQAQDLGSNFSSAPRFGGKLEELMEFVRRAVWRKNQVAIVSRQAARLRELWQDQSEGETETSNLQIIEASLSQGFSLTYPDRSELVILTDGEIFGWERPQPRRRTRFKGESPETSYADLKAGDWVVHVDYGIGRFMGLVRRTLEGADREFLQLEYADDDELFVPVHQADRISLYVGPDERPPHPTRLGTPEWQATKTRVRGAVHKVAWDLLDLYARRETAEGFSFQPDTVWQKELEASFPYIETDDQVRAIAEVKTDMEKHRPMDRLLMRGCRLRQDRGGPAGSLQGGHGWQAGGHAGAHHHPGAAAF